MGLTNAAANIMSIIAPLLVGFVVKHESDPAEWRLVFFISAGIYFVGNLMFVIFSKTEIQVWNDPEHRDRREFIQRIIIIVKGISVMYGNDFVRFFWCSKDQKKHFKVIRIHRMKA